MAPQDQLHPSIKTLIMIMMTLKNTMTIAKSMMTMSAEKKIMADDDDASEVKPRMDWLFMVSLAFYGGGEDSNQFPSSPNNSWK